jgi:frataxin-like iron-binding protein CyaY
MLLGNVLDIGTPSDDTVATAKIQDDAVTTAKINNDAVTLAKMASGTDGNIISYDTSGNPVAVATGTDGQVLTSSGAGAVCAFEDASGGDNTPSFLAYKTGSAQTISDETDTKITFDTEDHDSDSAYSSDTFTVPSGEGGKYVINAGIYIDNSNPNKAHLKIYKNGAEYARATNSWYHASSVNTTFIATLAATDYIEIYGWHNSGVDRNANQNYKYCYFGMYKLLGV